jgi:hypothetical protein
MTDYNKLLSQLIDCKYGRIYFREFLVKENNQNNLKNYTNAKHLSDHQIYLEETVFCKKFDEFMKQSFEEFTFLGNFYKK